MAVLHRERFNDPELPRLLAVHGITGHGRRYERLATERWTDRRVMAVDLRGHGASLDEAPWSLEQHAVDLIDTLDAEEWNDPVDVVGHSFGGAIALMLLALAPGRIRRLVILDPALHTAGPHALAMAQATLEFEGFESRDAAFAARCAQLDPSGHWAIDEEVAVHLRGPDATGRFRFGFRVAPIVAGWGEMARTLPRLPQRRPTLLVRALGADVCGPAFVAALRDQLGGALTERDLDCGHMVYWEAFEDTAASVSEFLGAAVPGR